MFIKYNRVDPSPDIDYIVQEIIINSIVQKNISKHRQLKALVYFAVNNHMYLILDDVVRKSLIESTKVKENFNTPLLKNEEEKEENNIYNNIKLL